MSWRENLSVVFQATKTKKPMTVLVTLMDGRSINLPVDSASTSKEVCQLLANKVQLKDTFGFSLYVALYEKVCSPRRWFDSHQFSLTLPLTCPAGVGSGQWAGARDGRHLPV